MGVELTERGDCEIAAAGAGIESGNCAGVHESSRLALGLQVTQGRAVVAQTVYEWIDAWDETKSIPGRYLPMLHEAFEAGRTAGQTSCDAPRQSASAVCLHVTQDRVLIRADREENAPKQTASGIYTAQSLAAAVDGSDSGESWFVGTFVQLGPLVRRFDVRDVVLDWLQELIDHEHDMSVAELKALRMRVRALPQDHVDPLRVGDRVVFSWASGQQIAIGEDKYVLLHMLDILAIVEEE